jgi:hypothetical protein
MPLFSGGEAYDFDIAKPRGAYVKISEYNKSWQLSKKELIACKQTFIKINWNVKMALHHSMDHNEGHIAINKRSSQPQRRPAVKFPEKVRQNRSSRKYCSSGQFQLLTFEFLQLKLYEKLMNALDSGKYFDCIRWTADGLAFEIVDPVGVEKKLLKEVFNGTKVQSFIRKVSFILE